MLLLIVVDNMKQYDKTDSWKIVLNPLQVYIHVPLFLYVHLRVPVRINVSISYAERVAFMYETWSYFLCKNWYRIRHGVLYMVFQLRAYYILQTIIPIIKLEESNTYRNSWS